MIVRYVLDAGALIAAERRKQRALRFFQLAAAGGAELLIPLPVVAEWWRGASAVRERVLAAARVISDLEVMKAAGSALRTASGVNASLTIDAIVIATAALYDGIVVTQDPVDLGRFGAHFPGVPILSV